MSADAVTKLMKDWTKRELAETLANAAELTSDDVYTATVLDVADTGHNTVRVTIEVNATAGDLLSLRAGHRVSLSMNDDLPGDLATWQG